MSKLKSIHDLEQYEDTGGKKSQLLKDYVTDGTIIMMTDHEEVHKGHFFRAWSYRTVGDNSSTFIKFTTGEKYIHLKRTRLWANNAEVWLKLWKIPDSATSVVAFIPRNANHNSSESSTITVGESATVTLGTGTLMDFNIAGGGGANQAAKSGDDVSEDDENILLPSTIYVVQIHNNSGGAANVLARFGWYETTLDDG